jgi:ABC-2 type transport system permease protein
LEEYGNDYFFFLIIGIAISDLALRISSIINTEVRNYQLTGLFEEIINLRESTTSILLFSLIYPIFYSSIRLIIYLVAAVLFFNLNLSYANLGFIIIALMLVIFSFIGISLISGAYAIAFKKGNPLSAINQISVMVLGGVFFPTTILPPWLSTISQFIPITHALEVIRYLFLPNNYMNDQTIYHLLIMVLFSFSLILLGLLLCGYAVKTGKKNGTLTIY